MPIPRSNVRVEVTFDEAAVFAGESLSAVITFWNVSGYNASRSHQHHNHHQRKRSLISLDEIPQQDSHNHLGVEGITSGVNRSLSLRSSKRESWQTHGASTSVSDAMATSRNSMSLSRPDPHSEGMIMGFVQLQGYFELDDNIVDTEAFEHIKRHGVIVSSKGLDYGSSVGKGLLKGLRSGIGSFFGNMNQSNSQFSQNLDAIPIFTTPQSLLFVDLKLSPGESKSFRYHIDLPKELPPSCRGKSIRIHYNLAIGTQKMDFAGRPHPKIILVPFRLFPHVDNIGSQPVHDFDNPIVEKIDRAIISQFTDRKPNPKVATYPRRPSQDQMQTKKSIEDLQTYIDTLLSPSSNQQNLVSSEVNVTDASRRASSLLSASLSGDSSANYSCKDNIEFFVRYQHLDAEKPFKSNFDIGRGGHRIASASLSKPVFRVGEDIVLLLDFNEAVLPCYHVTASLETTEQISAEVARKNETETYISTRRIFSQLASSSFSSLKKHFNFTIPSTATPQFETSAISLHWSIKLDFITGVSNEHEQKGISILQPGHTDDHGTVKVPLHVLQCETFSARIPLQVYPTNHDISALLDSTHMSRKWVL